MIKKNIFLKYFNIYTIILIFSLILGTVIRIFGLFSLGYYFDTITTQYDWGKNALDFGYFEFWNKYPESKLFDYPPLNLLYLMNTVFLSSKIDIPKEISFIIFHKSFIWIFEVIFISIFGLLLNKSKLLSKNQILVLVSFLYIFPSLWFVSAIWGQSDIIAFVVGIIGLIFLFIPNNKFVNNKIWYKSQFFISGVIWSIAIWFKQQPLLFLPIIFIYFLQNLKWKEFLQIILFSLPFLVTLYYFNKIYSLEAQNIYFFNLFVIENYLLMRNLMLVFLITLTSTLFLLIINFKNISEGIFKIIHWVFGVVLITSIISIPLMLTNYKRFGSVVFAMVGREDLVHQGGFTFWSAFSNLKFGSDNLIQIYNLNITVSKMGLLIFTFLFFVAFWVIFDLNIKKISSFRLNKIFEKKLTLGDLFWLLWVLCSAYFFFFTKIHSRYLHYAICLGWLGLATLKNIKSFKTGLVILTITNILYFINQLYVFADNNSDPIWTNIIFQNLINQDKLNLNLKQLIPFLGTYTFLISYVWLITNYKEKFQQEKNN